MTTATLFMTIGLLANSVVIGAPLWVFFLQGPALFAFMGRSKFLPPMLRLTRLLFRWTLVISAALVLLTELMLDGSFSRTSFHFASVSLAAALVNALIIVPQALSAGAKATMKNYDDDGKLRNQVKDMAISGGDPSEKSGTKILHQTVVVFVVIMFVGSIGYVYSLLSSLS
mmetsp:Transcript_18488/g.29789  ORF Transcript_18488/g.29789 Transcript_18488/m.29789 type:complete len:171 (+) Transcript_18488:1-513(+)